MVEYRRNLLDFQELYDIHVTFIECGRIAPVAARQYQQLYPNRVHPDRRFFENLDRRLRETGTFQMRIEGRGRRGVKFY